MTEPIQPRTVIVPPGMQAHRLRAPRVAEVPGGEIPLIPKNGTKEQQLKEVWTTHVRLFDFSDPQQLKDYETVWQNITNGTARLSKEDGPHFSPQTSTWTTFLRWADITYKV